jgi:pyruvate/2-oxoglutarate dehydrogenase complex dihydrolipoamide acyltransferase (E2) component
VKTPNYRIVGFPKSRLATFDIGAVGKRMHYVSALLELDVTVARERIKSARAERGARISFTSWLLKTIGDAIGRHKEVAAFRCGRRKLMIFDDAALSIVVEKELDGAKVPIPLVIRNVNGKSIEEIADEIEKAKSERFANGRVVLGQGASAPEKLYYLLPGRLRRTAWRFILSRPRLAYEKMGNAVFTSVGMMGRVNGWFTQTSVHPISFGVGSIIRKPVVVGEDVKVREVLHLTLLIDHDAVDGAPMARFVSDLSESVESGSGL